MHLSRFHLTRVVLPLLFANAAVHAASHQKRATICNGFAELCDRTYGNVTFVGAHDSYAVGVKNLAANQDYDVTQQLTDGIRMLQVQVHNDNGALQLCHTSCGLYDGGTLSDYMGKVKSWMDSNPNDVVSMLIVNSDNLPVSQFADAYKTAGVDTISYSPPAASLPATGWPTLGTLIDSGTRLVSFMASQADFTTVPYIIDEFTNIWETAFDVTDTTFDCNVNRTGGDPTTQMYLINHFLDQIILGVPAPDPSRANSTNAVGGVGSLGQQVSTCVTANGRNPNFMLVDFYEYGGGSVFEVAATANGVTYNPTTPIAKPIPQDGSASPTSTARGGGASVTTGPNTNAGVGLFDGHKLYGSLAVAGSVLGMLMIA